MSEVADGTARFPCDWQSVAVGDAFHMQLGKMLSKASKIGKTPKPYLGNKNVQWDRVDLTDLETMDFTESEQEKFALLPGDLLVCEGGEVGRTSVWHGELAGCFYQKAIHRLRPKDGSILPEYMLRFMRLAAESGWFTNFTSQSSIAHLTREKLATVQIHAPNIPEQRKIARILTTLDELIEKTEALIAKYQAVKQGMMHDLFTRGVDEHGHLRPAYDEAPELYKKSELGWIPMDWECVQLSDEIDILHGYAFEGEYFADTPPGEVLLVPGNFHRDGGLYFAENNIKYFRGPVPAQTVLNNGDLVVVMTDLSPRTLILGRVAEINLPFTVLHNQRIGLIRQKRSDEWNRRFLLFAMNNQRLRSEIILTATGTTVRHTSPTKILANYIAKAPKAEQDRTAACLSHIDENMKAEITQITKMREIKTGLMQDLLTGKVRVKPDEGGGDV